MSHEVTDKHSPSGDNASGVRVMETAKISRLPGMTWTLLLRILVPLLLASGFFHSVYASLQKQEAHPGKAILLKDPKSGREFKSWSLFLVCNPEWLASEKEADLNDLYLSFGHFGAAIGDDNLAVWFSKWKDEKHPARGWTVDVERSSQFCRDWGLVPSRGPHLVVTTTYPGGVESIPLINEPPHPPQMPDNSAVFDLGNMKPAEVHKLIAKLTDVLVRNQKVTTELSQPVTVKQPPGLFVRILEAVQHTINDFSCVWSFKVNAGLVQAELQACHTRVR